LGLLGPRLLGHLGPLLALGPAGAQDGDRVAADVDVGVDRDVDLVAAEDPVTGAAGLSPLLADLLAPGVVGRLLQRLDDGGAGGSGRGAEDGDGVAAEVEG